MFKPYFIFDSLDLDFKEETVRTSHGAQSGLARAVGLGQEGRTTLGRGAE